MTRNQLSYQKPRDSEATVRTATTTRTLQHCKDKENSNEKYGDTTTTTTTYGISSRRLSNSEARRSSIDDDNWKSKFNSNEHFEKAHRKFSGGGESASQCRRDSFEKYDTKRQLFSKTDSAEKFCSTYSSSVEGNDNADEYSQFRSSSPDRSDGLHGKTQIVRNNSFKEVKNQFQQATGKLP